MSMTPETKAAAQATAVQAARGGTGFLVAILLAPLPPAWRFSVDHRLRLNVDRAAVPSGVAQAAIAFAIAVFGYVAWYHGLTTALDAGAERLDATGKYDKESYQIIGHAGLAMNPLLPLIYVLTSPVGFLSALGLAGGTIRAINGAATGDNIADPTLTLLEGVRALVFRRGRRLRREAAKGLPVPDRIEVGDLAEAGYDIRITSASEFPWRPGNTIVMAGEPLILLAKSEVHDEAGWLRIRYDLRRFRVGEIIRAPKEYVPTQAPEIGTAAPPG